MDGWTVTHIENSCKDLEIGKTSLKTKSNQNSSFLVSSRFQHWSDSVKT